MLWFLRECWATAQERLAKVVFAGRFLLQAVIDDGTNVSGETKVLDVRKEQSFQERLSLLCFLEFYIAPWRIVVRINEHCDKYGDGPTGERRDEFTVAKKDRPQVKFVGIRVSTEVKVKFEKWTQRASFDWLAELEHQLQAGLKVGTSWDRKNQCYIVSLTNWIEEDDNYGWCFSTRHSDLQKAFQLMLYKLLVVLDGLTWEEHDAKDDFG